MRITRGVLGNCRTVIGQHLTKFQCAPPLVKAAHQAAICATKSEALGPIVRYVPTISSFNHGTSNDSVSARQLIREIRNLHPTCTPPQNERLLGVRNLRDLHRSSLH